MYLIKIDGRSIFTPCLNQNTPSVWQNNSRRRGLCHRGALGELSTGVLEGSKFEVRKYWCSPSHGGLAIELHFGGIHMR